MATNKWLSSLNDLNNSTSILREKLINLGIDAGLNESLPALINKIPSNLPARPTNQKWIPDSKWVFPDPNGSENSKFINEIYDEDTLATTYTYRGIYLIYGDRDIIDLKLMMSSRTNADTFITSDGSVYNDITDATLLHTWNKSYDILDSKNRIVRYVKIYSNTAHTGVPGFYGQLIWAIQAFGTSISVPSGTKVDALINYSMLTECIELRGNYTNLASMSPYNIGYPLKLVITSAFSSAKLPTGAGYSLGARLIELDIPNCTEFQCMHYLGSSSNGYAKFMAPFITDLKFGANLTTLNLIYSFFASLKNLDLSECVKLTSLTLDRGTGDLTLSSPLGSRYTTAYAAHFMPSYNFTLPQTLKTLKISGGSYETLNLPTELTSLTLSYLPLKYVDLPQTITTLSLEYLPIEELTIPESFCSNNAEVTTIFNLSKLYNLRNIIVTTNFNRNANFTCEHLEYDSIIEILNNLKDLSGATAKTLTLGEINLAKLTDEEKAIATNKNWNLA